LVIAPGIATKVAWECVHLGNTAEGQKELQLCKENGFYVVAIDAGDISNEESLFATIAAAMNFPVYFGMNWDALSDLLRDLSWLSPKGVLVVLEDSKALWREPALSGNLIELWLFCAEAWAKSDIPFHLAFTWG
jgi:RNAse (barnase) inhibitor barstar